MASRIFIDCQFFQTPVWDRGMGKYTLSLLEQAREDLSELPVTLIFNKNLPMGKQMLSAIEKVLPEADHATIDLKTTDNDPYSRAAPYNRKMLEETLDLAGQPAADSDIFFIPCLFQEPTASVFPSATRKVVIYYDAIPFLYYQKYRNAINYDNYLQRHRTLLEADAIMTISETVKDDLAIYLGMEETRRRIVSIDGAAVVESDEISKPSIKLPSEFILLNTSDDVRKNNLTAVKALKQLQKVMKKDVKMVITSAFRDEHRRELLRLTKDIIFAGNVQPEELNWLYQNAKVVFTTSEYEGLGLPILEAARFNKPIACSNIAVFREISSEAFYFFDPLDIEDITLQLKDAMEEKGWDDKQKHYPDINKKYTWGRSAGVLIKELNNLGAATTAGAKPKIAILCPTPSGYSAIGRIVQENHDGLSAFFDIDYYFEERKKDKVSIRPNYLECVAKARPVSDFTARSYADYDMVVYHIGNSEYHFETIRDALYLPGIAIIHDTKLSECFGEMARLGYISTQRFEAEAQLDGLVTSDKTAFISSILNDQIGVVVHSDYAQQAAKTINLKQVLLQRANLAVAVPKQEPRRVTQRAVHVGLGGVLSGKRKGIDILKELASDPDISETAMFHVFGFNLLDKQDASEINSYDNITFKTDLSDLAYQTQLANLDIMVNYRSDYKGETSSSVLEAMRYGCTVVVNGSVGWFAELPDESVAKVNSPEQLEDTIKELIKSSKKREAIGRAARDYMAHNHSISEYGRKLEALYIKARDTDNVNKRRSAALKNTGTLSQAQSALGEL